MKKPSKPYTNKNGDIRPLTRAEMKTFRPAKEIVPHLVAASRRGRPSKGTLAKQPVNLRLSPEVVAFFKTKGSGWQTRIDDALKAIVTIVH